MRVLFLFILFVSVLGWSFDPIELFTENGRPVQRYDQEIKNIGVGRTVFFPDKSEFKILGRLEGGGTNKIFRAQLLNTGEIGILRIPKESDALHFATETLKGYRLLNEERIKVPELIRGVNSQYVFQKEVTVELTAFDLLGGNLKKTRASEDELFRRLVLLFGRTAKFRRLDDASPENVYFDGVEWGILDWQGKHAFFDGRRNNSLLNYWESEKNDRPEVKKFWIDANAAIEKVRAANPQWLDLNCESRFRNIVED